uniref:Resolvase/integrase-like protein n=1 Tax=Histophilus somni (strain 129Pt) TaxID=205914 RepID=Q0I2B2_HISS1
MKLITAKDIKNNDIAINVNEIRAFYQYIKQLNELLNYIREGDVVVTKLDRLGRSLSQCLKLLDMLTENKNRLR